MSPSLRVNVALCLLYLALGGCRESVQLRSDDASAQAVDGATDASPDASSTTDARTSSETNDDGSSPFAVNDAGQVLCGSDAPCGCDNGLDDDGDGLIDGDDPECTGPYDDDEATFATGIPGDNKDFCQDCFFDGDSGSGNDGCQYNTECLYGRTPEPRGNSSCFSCEVSAKCVDYCTQRTPNGCDCFGCCDVQRGDGSTVHVYLAATCSLDEVDDEQACPRCTPSSDCRNDCGRCELCPGRTVADLPADCNETPVCEGSSAPCNADLPCGDGKYCLQGCCMTRLD